MPITKQQILADEARTGVKNISMRREYNAAQLSAGAKKNKRKRVQYDEYFFRPTELDKLSKKELCDMLSNVPMQQEINDDDIKSRGVHSINIEERKLWNELDRIDKVFRDRLKTVGDKRLLSLYIAREAKNKRARWLNRHKKSY